MEENGEKVETKRRGKVMYMSEDEWRMMLGYFYLNLISVANEIDESIIFWKYKLLIIIKLIQKFKFSNKFTSNPSLP